MRPVIGIPLCLDDHGRWRQGRDYLYSDRAYARAVERGGGTPLHLPLQGNVAELVSRLDGLLVPGGDDLLPDRRYPEDVVFEAAPAAQLEFDRRLLEAGLARGLPVLGICYGMQLLALHHGGSLHYHLPLDVPRAAAHQLPEGDGRHEVFVVPGTRIERWLGATRAEVNSLHHQGVADPGDGMRICARSPDGVVEAIERPTGPFCLGVQWHPEKLQDEPSDGLFRALASACLAGAGGI